MSHPNPPTSRNNSIINGVGRAPGLTRGPSPSLNNIRDNTAEYLKNNIPDQATIILDSNDDITTVLKHTEATLNRINQRLDTIEKDISSLKLTRRHHENNQLNSFSAYTQLILIIIVAIILKYIFH